MNIKKSIKTIEQEVITFVAADGTEFTDRDECQKYEKSAEGYINAQYIKCFGKHARVDNGITPDEFNMNTYSGDIFEGFGGSSEDFIFALTFKSKDDVEAFHKYNSMHNWDYSCVDKLGDEIIGKTLIFRGYDGGWYCIGTADELLASVRKTLNIISHNLKCKDCGYWNDEECICTHNVRGEWYANEMKRLKGMIDPCDKFERA